MRQGMRFFWRLINRIKSVFEEVFRTLKAIYYLGKWKKKQDKHYGVIKVAFIVQMAEIWDKERLVYEEMAKDRVFHPELIVVPPYDAIQNRVQNEYQDNFFLKEYPQAIRAFKNNSWIDLKTKHYQYVFYQRPYDHYLPKGLRSCSVVKYAKCCYIPYAYSGAHVFDSGNSNRRFFDNIYFAFLESDYMVGLFKKRFWFSVRQELRHIECLGYPVFDLYYNSRESSGKYSSVIWTPRWSFDKKRGAGGSNFIKYKDLFLALAKANSEISFVFRPHPLMMSELLKKEILSTQEISVFLKQIKELNIYYDTNRSINEALTNADVLITDYSSIIIEYFVTGRPIIYCDSGIEFNEVFELMKPGIYQANTGEEVKSFLMELISGNDPLKQVRDKIIKNKLLLSRNASKRIIERIKEDSEGEHR